jgi:hypothetical protein
MRSDSTGAPLRRAWEPPSVTKLAIGAQTKSSPVDAQAAAVDAQAAAAEGQGRIAEPSPPAAPASKLGFSIEMGFPLSARTEG